MARLQDPGDRRGHERGAADADRTGVGARGLSLPKHGVRGISAGVPVDMPLTPVLRPGYGVVVQYA
ncbi:protein of unknown function [Streptomyces murinus]